MTSLCGQVESRREYLPKGRQTQSGFYGDQALKGWLETQELFVTFPKAPVNQRLVMFFLFKGKKRKISHHHAIIPIPFQIGGRGKVSKFATCEPRASLIHNKGRVRTQNCRVFCCCCCLTSTTPFLYLSFPPSHSCRSLREVQ